MGGGQPVSLSLSFQYRLTESKIPDVYGKFGQSWSAPYLRFAQQSITNVAQEFTPRAFWTSRHELEQRLLAAVNDTLWEQGFAEVYALQLRAVGFQSSYEQTIINIQLQEQLRVTKSYQLEVTRVVEGQANANALEREQNSRASMYAKLRAHLGWS